MCIFAFSNVVGAFSAPVTLHHIVMQYAIIAAGEGSRLFSEGVAKPKPLVEVGGEPLIDRLCRLFMEQGAEQISIICNEQMTEVQQHLSHLQQEGLRGTRLPLEWICRSTPSSMHSLHALASLLQERPFVLTTVDTIFRDEELNRYVRAFEAALQEGWDGLMGVTDFVDDEKPLWVEVDERMSIRGFHDQRVGNSPWISAGIYGLTPRALAVLSDCVMRGEQRMRNFQRALVAQGLRLRAYAFSKVFDVDHATDVAKAQAFLSAHADGEES